MQHFSSNHVTALHHFWDVTAYLRIWTVIEFVYDRIVAASCFLFVTMHFVACLTGTLAILVQLHVFTDTIAWEMGRKDI